MSNFLVSIINKLRSFNKREEGTAAIEFALIAPIMIITFLGTVEISHAWLSKEKIEAATETIADLVAQGQSMTKADLDQMFTLTRATLTTAEEAGINIVVTQVTTEPDPGDPSASITTVDYSCTKTGTPPRSPGDPYTELPAGLAANYESLIVTELEYEYTSLLGKVISGVLSFDRSYINRPRYVSSIECPDCITQC